MLDAAEFQVLLSTVSRLDREQCQALRAKLAEVGACPSRKDLATDHGADLRMAVGGISRSLMAFRKKQLNDARTSADALQRSNDALEALSRTDTLTGLGNRRAFDRYLASACRGEEHRLLALAMIDVDHFKLFNDHFGHPAGDACLQQVAHALRSASRDSGMLAARYGGEEFAVIMPGKDASAASDHADVLRAAVERLRIPHVVGTYVSVSIGVAVAGIVDERVRLALIEAADQALYAAKKGGRNRVEAAPQAVGLADTARGAIS